MVQSATNTYPVPYRDILIIAAITIPLFGISAAVPMPLLFTGEFTWAETRFGLLSAMMNAGLFWLLNTLLLSLFFRYVPPRYQWLRYLASLVICGLAAYFFFRLIRILHLHPEPIGGPRFHIRFDASPNIGPPRTRDFQTAHRPWFNIFAILPGQSTNILILVLTEIILLRKKKEHVEKENNQLRIANLEGKHNLLKQQLQPHFLFNSLSIIKALIKKDTVKADHYVEMLSELLRYSVYANNNYKVTVEEEIKYVSTYLKMQKIRFKDALIFNFDIPGELLNGLVPIHSLQLLAENAQKHNMLSETSPLLIKVSGDARLRTICVENNLQPKSDFNTKKGLGLKNLRERYQLLGGTDLQITQTKDQFIVTLKLLEDEHSDH